VIKRQIIPGVLLTALIVSCGQSQINNQVQNPDSSNLQPQEITGGSRTIPVRAFYDSTVSTYGYTGSYDNARTKWSNISSRVGSISKVAAKDATADIYKVFADANNTNLGETRGYVNGVLDNSGVGNWSYASIAINNEQVKNGGNGYTAAELIRFTALHELGHSLKLNDSTTTTNSVMGFKIAYETLQPFDISELRRKWGN
jgi:hypothetical protein